MLRVRGQGWEEEVRGLRGEVERGREEGREMGRKILEMGEVGRGVEERGREEVERF